MFATVNESNSNCDIEPVRAKKCPDRPNVAFTFVAICSYATVTLGLSGQDIPTVAAAKKRTITKYSPPLKTL